MARCFNVSGPCRSDKHYMVNLQSRLEEIRQMIDNGEYFVINKARQYGKTTVLRSLAQYLKKDYQVLSLDFQNIESDEFENGNVFVHAFARETNKRMRRMDGVPREAKEKMLQLADNRNQYARMAELFACFSEWCEQSERPFVLVVPAFQSVILAGVYDIRNIRRKLRPDETHKENGPWNIAADILVDMSFSADDIVGMLEEYETDHHTGMEIGQIAKMLYDDTSGYPYLVSRLCKLMDERLAGTEEFPDKASVWTKKGCLAAVKILLEENNPLFDSLVNKLGQFPELNAVISRQLFQGQPVAYAPDDTAVRDAFMFGFVKVKDSTVQIANRIFETRLYHRFLADYRDQGSEIYAEGVRQKNQFIWKDI